MCAHIHPASHDFPHNLLCSRRRLWSVRCRVRGRSLTPTLLCAPGLSDGHDSDPGKSKPSQDSPLLSSVLRVFSTRFRGRHLPQRVAAVPWAGAEGVCHRFPKHALSFAVPGCLGPETEPCSWSLNETASCKHRGPRNPLQVYRGPLPSPKPSKPAPDSLRAHSEARERLPGRGRGRGSDWAPSSRRPRPLAPARSFPVPWRRGSPVPATPEAGPGAGPGAREPENGVRGAVPALGVHEPHPPHPGTASRPESRPASEAGAPRGLTVEVARVGHHGGELLELVQRVLHPLPLHWGARHGEALAGVRRPTMPRAPRPGRRPIRTRRGRAGRSGTAPWWKPRPRGRPPARETKPGSRRLRRALRVSLAPGGDVPPLGQSHPAASVVGLGVLGTHAIALKCGRQAESPRSALPALTLSTQSRSACSLIGSGAPWRGAPPTQALPSEGPLRRNMERCLKDHVKTRPRASRVQGSLETLALHLGRSLSAIQRGPPALGPLGEKGPLSAGTGCAEQPLP